MTTDPADKFQAGFKELVGIFRNVEAGVMAPTHPPDFSNLPHETLISRVVASWAAPRHEIIKGIDTKESPWKVYERANSILENLSPKMLAGLFYLGNFNLESLLFVIQQRQHWFHAYQELLKRIESQNVGRQIAHVPLADRKPLLINSLKAHIRMRGVYYQHQPRLRIEENKEVVEWGIDAKEESQVMALEFYRNITEDAAKLIKAKGLPTRLPKKRVKMWTVLEPRLIELEVQHFVKSYLPIIRGDFETRTFAERVYQKVRWWIHQQQRGLPLMGASYVQDDMDEWDENELNPEVEEIWAADGVARQQIVDSIRQVFRVAERQHGSNSKLSHVFKYVLQGYTWREASNKAGMPTRTQRYLIKRIREDLPPAPVGLWNSLDWDNLQPHHLSHPYQMPHPSPRPFPGTETKKTAWTSDPLPIKKRTKRRRGGK